MSRTTFSDRSSLHSLIRTARGQRRWDETIPPHFRPLLRAYLLAYVSVVAPKILSVLAIRLTGRRASKARQLDQDSPYRGAASTRRLLVDALRWQRFPAFCAALVGGSTLLEPLFGKIPFRSIFGHLAKGLSGVARQRLSRWCASFVAAWLSIQLLQSKRSASFSEVAPATADSLGETKRQTVRYAGRTLDLSLFAATRALDVVVGELWSRREVRRRAAGKWTGFESAVSRLIDPAVFALSSGVIMWTWIYSPERLPHTYDKWIASAASVDSRLIEALRRCRQGLLRYGEETGQAPLLQGMCKDYNWPLEWGDPARTIPFPCEMVHMGCGPSCELHALSRFERSFRWAMRTYLPLSLLLILRNPNKKGGTTALVSAARSSAFLGTFITLFYYGVCLARTRLGPKLLGRDSKTSQRIDGGICVASGCFFCGWSIMIEQSRRRKDIALFVAPRALATLLPRRYSWDKQWRETFVFAFSTAMVFTCVLENKRRVRGVLGNILAAVLAP